MKIAIIGTGNVGAALGGSFVRAGHEVTFAARDGAKTATVAATAGARTASTPSAAAAAADVIVLAVPYTEAIRVAGEIAVDAAGKVLVDATNPLKADYSGLSTVGGPSGAERIQKAAAATKVVKAFNTVFASLQANPGLNGQAADALIAGDDAAAKATVAGLASSIGLRPIDAGSLVGATELEALAWLNIALQLRTGGNWSSSFVLIGAPEKAIAA
ncbi:MAG: NAD(P)-binding domain-containing protein [Chloroflexi bacterium]|nr:NAD(P)-binding domain-containing protein [Chloroflexota bacterium]